MEEHGESDGTVGVAFEVPRKVLEEVAEAADRYVALYNYGVSAFPAYEELKRAVMKYRKTLGR